MTRRPPAGPATRRPRGVRAGLLVVLGAGLSGLIGGALSPAAADPQLPGRPVFSGASDPSAAARSVAAGRVEVRLTGMSPVTVTDDRSLVLSGRVTSGYLRTLRDVTVSLQLSTSAITARSAVDDVLEDPGYTAPVAGAEDPLRPFPTGSSQRFVLTADTSTLPLSVTGVYPVRVVVEATVGGVPQEVGAVTTLLPWYSATDQVARTRLLFLWPLIDTPHRDRSGTFEDDSLATQLSPGGRLYRLVAAGADRPVGWVVDPALLAEASAMSAGYTVAAPGATGATGAPGDGAASGSAEPSDEASAAATSRGAGSAQARQWLEAFNLASSRAEVATVPYGDVDVTSTLDAGHARLLRAASRWGAAQASDILGRTVRHDLAWPVAGQASQAAVDRLTAAGQRAVLLSGAEAAPADVLAYTPSGRAEVGDTDTPALLSDPVLDAEVAAPHGREPVLARQRFLGETLLVTAELPTASRLLVVAPPRRWDPSRAYAQALARGLSRAAWLRPVDLDTALAWPVPTITREDLPTSAPPDQLPPSYVDEAARTNEQLRTFASVLTEPDPIVPDYRAALYSSLSTAWRDDVPAGLHLLTDTTQALDKQRGQVRIVSRGGTLTSTSGPFPVTVVNDLDQAVHVGLDVRSTDPLRMRMTAPQDVRVPAGARVSVDARVEATTSGDLVATAQLLTPRSRHEYSDPVELQVRVRAYGQVALLVFGGAAALLVLAAGVRLVRRVRNARAGGGAG